MKETAAFYYCMVCNCDVQCRIGKVVRRCYQCEAEGFGCVLEDLEITFDIVPYYCDKHSKGVYRDGNGKPTELC